MKLSTLEHYIKYTTIPYTELLKRAERGGLVVKRWKDGAITLDATNGGRIALYPHDDNNINGGMAGITYIY